jgi:hypothetical protein
MCGVSGQLKRIDIRPQNYGRWLWGGGGDAGGRKQFYVIICYSHGLSFERILRFSIDTSAEFFRTRSFNFGAITEKTVMRLFILISYIKALHSF